MPDSNRSGRRPAAARPIAVNPENELTSHPASSATRAECALPFMTASATAVCTSRGSLASRRGRVIDMAEVGNGRHGQRTAECPHGIELPVRERSTN